MYWICMRREPLWPDPADPSPSAVNRSLATPKEKWGFLPLFMIQNYFSRGRLGYWNPALTGPGLPTPQVIGHTQWIPDTDSSISKKVVQMLSGHYDWSLAHEWEGQAVFFANKKHDGSIDDKVSQYQRRMIERCFCSCTRFDMLKKQHKLLMYIG